MKAGGKSGVGRWELTPMLLVALLLTGAAYAQAPAAPLEKEARVYGQKIHYLEAGSTGPVVILLHGLGVDSNQWRLTMSALAGYRVLAPDQIGSGKSDKPPLNYRVQTLVDFLDGFYRESGVQRATLVGNSLGGWVALAFALAHPAKVEKLVLVDSAGYSNQRWQGPAPTRDELLKLNPSTLAGTRELLGLIFANKLLVNDVTVQAAFTQRLAAADGHVVNAFIDSILRNEDYVDGRLGAVKVPTLIVWGREDGLLPVAVGEAFAKDIAGARLTVLDKCGHVPHLECATTFNGALAGFLK